jgi:hypothetical protein
MKTKILIWLTFWCSIQKHGEHDHAERAADVIAHMDRIDRQELSTEEKEKEYSEV